MKRYLTLLFLFFYLTLFSQSGINYKAVIKDGGGNILASSPISIQFIIYEGAALTNNVYQESHTTNTDGNGLVIVNIGEGTTANVFENIEWGIDEHFLNVQVNTGSGLVDMGTTAFKTVPYAINAEKANNVNGLEAVDEGNGIGHRVIGRNLNNLGNIGLNAVDLSVSPIASSTYGATGTYSVAMNRQTTAQGSNATAMGLDSKAYGNTSTTMGFNSIANGYDSVAMGAYTVADAVQSVVMGRYNLGGGHNQIWNPLEPLFEIGNGSNNANRSNALTVLKNGTITAPSLTNSLIDLAGDKALVTKEYIEDNINPTGLEVLNEGNGLGWRLTGANTSNFGDIGLHAIDLSASLSPNVLNGATGDYSFSIGLSSRSVGDHSISVGGSSAHGDYAAALGRLTTANGYNSLSFGTLTSASGDISATFGNDTRANSLNAFVLGRYNIGGGNSSNWVETDPLFEIGNGTSNSNRNNALTVLKNGKVGIGNNLPISPLDISYDSSATSPHINLKETTGSFASISFTNTTRPNDYWTIAGLLGSTFTNDRLVIINSDGGTLMSIHGNGDVFVTGTLTHASDKRLKSDIEKIQFGLNEILQLNPVQYNWKNQAKKANKSLGLIAQEVQPIIRNIVSENKVKNEEHALGVSYTELIPVLVKAIQEQQDLINDQKTKLDNQNSKIEMLSEENDQQDLKIQSLSEHISEILQLSQRINKLEANQKTFQK